MKSLNDMCCRDVAQNNGRVPLKARMNISTAKIMRMNTDVKDYSYKQIFS